MTPIARIRLAAALAYAGGALANWQFAVLVRWLPVLNTQFGWHPLRDSFLAVAGVAVAVLAATYAEQIDIERPA